MKSIIICLGMLASTLVWSQHTFELQDTVGVYSEAETVVGESRFKIPVNFDAEKLLSTIPDSLKDLAIYRVDLAYTTYRLNPDFDQIGLNNNRITRLKNAWPELNNPMIQWRSIGQSDADNAEVAKTFFHGFVVYYRPAPTAESIETEIALLDEILLGAESDEVEVQYELTESRDVEEVGIIPPLAVSDKRIGKVTELSSDAVVVSEFKGSTLDWRCVDTDTINVIGKKALKNKLDSLRESPDFLGYIYSRESKLHIGKRSRELIWYSKSEMCDSARRVIEPIYVSRFEPTYPGWMKKGDYGVVKSVFERNPTWENTLVVMDVTGSMSPYIAKTMAWIKTTQEEPKVNAFVFFNDGDNKRDKAKKTGSVGGVYGTENDEFKDVYQVLKSTMRKGGGGDCPENNIEATLYGVSEYKDCDEVVMVADNWATPRDLSLVKDLDVPVHVILCGATGALNIDYLQLAYDTGGSVHTIEEDLDMKGVKPGEQFKVGNFYFTIVKGRIVRANN